jgi:hypothetical protein
VGGKQDATDPDFKLSHSLYTLSVVAAGRACVLVYARGLSCDDRRPKTLNSHGTFAVSMLIELDM